MSCLKIFSIGLPMRRFRGPHRLLVLPEGTVLVVSCVKDVYTTSLVRHSSMGTYWSCDDDGQPLLLKMSSLLQTHNRHPSGMRWDHEHVSKVVRSSGRHFLTKKGKLDLEKLHFRSFEKSNCFFTWHWLRHRQWCRTSTARCDTQYTSMCIYTVTHPSEFGFVFIFEIKTHILEP